MLPHVRRTRARCAAPPHMPLLSAAASRTHRPPRRLSPSVPPPPSLPSMLTLTVTPPPQLRRRLPLTHNTLYEPAPSDGTASNYADLQMFEFRADGRPARHRPRMA